MCPYFLTHGDHEIPASVYCDPGLVQLLEVEVPVQTDEEAPPCLHGPIDFYPARYYYL